MPDPIKSAGTEAIHRRLGNLTSVKALHDDAACRLPPASTILRLVLYDGYHAGDVIAPERMDELQEELVALRRGAPISILFASFLDDLDHLVAASIEQSNPIVFVKANHLPRSREPCQKWRTSTSVRPSLTR